MLASFAACGGNAPSENLSLLSDDDSQHKTISDSESLFIAPDDIGVSTANDASVKPCFPSSPMAVGEFYDVGKTLYPEERSNDLDGVISGQFRKGFLHVWGSGKSFRYDYVNKEIVAAYNEVIVPLGQSHYYSRKQNDDSDWIISLFDSEMNRISEIQGSQYAMPSIDERFLVSVDQVITVVELMSGKEHIYDLNSLFGKDGAGYGRGDIVSSYFDGSIVYFKSYSMMQPRSSKSLIGYFDIVSGKSKCFELPLSFNGIPYYFAEKKIWYWQSKGGESEPDGSYGIMLDADTDTIRKIDVGTSDALLMNNNIIAVNADNRDSQHMERISAFTFFSGNDFKVVKTVAVNSENAPFYYNPGVGLTQSEDQMYICVAGFYDTSSSRHSLFVYRVK
jgi:hypothetical protein